MENKSCLLVKFITQSNICNIVYILNLIDLFFTMIALRIGVEEMNPLMCSLSITIIYKVIIVKVLLQFLSNRKERIVKYALYFSALLYMILDIYHVVNIFVLIK